MTDPLVILAALTAKAKEIPELLAELNDDPIRISAWVDAYPQQTSLVRMIRSRTPGSVTFAIEGIQPSSAPGYHWDFRFLAVMRPLDEALPESGAIWRMFRALATGRTSDGRRWNQQCFTDFSSQVGPLQADREPMVLSEADVIDLVVARFSIDDKDP